MNIRRLLIVIRHGVIDWITFLSVRALFLFVFALMHITRVCNWWEINVWRWWCTYAHILIVYFVIHLRHQIYLLGLQMKTILYSSNGWTEETAKYIQYEKRTNEEDSFLCQKNTPMYGEKCTDNTGDNCFLSSSIFFCDGESEVH